MDTLDTGIRLKAFQFLDEQCKRHGDVLPRKILAQSALVASPRSLRRGLVSADFQQSPHPIKNFPAIPTQFAS